MKRLIENMIQSAIASLQAADELPKNIDIQIQIERTRDKKYGHFACNIAMMLAKKVGMPPRDLAENILTHLPTSTTMAKATIAGPGFINFYLADNALHAVIKNILDAADMFGHADKGKGKRIHLEFVSANPTGPLHVGHGRSAAYGACVGNLLEAIGYTVHREYYVNDAGRQMRILALSVWLRYLAILKEPIVLPPNAYQGDYIVMIANEMLTHYQKQYHHTASHIETSLPAGVSPDDTEKYIDALADVMLTLIGKEGVDIFQRAALESILLDIKEDLAAFGVVYNEWFLESRLFAEGLLTQGIELLTLKKQVFKKDGALWFRATDYGDEKDRVLLRANGQPTYFASDVAYHLHKYRQMYDEIIDIFGADHHGYIQRITAFLKSVGEDPSKFSVLLVQFAILYRGKVKVQMSTRSGKFVTLRELRHEVGNDAARYFYIMRKPEQHLDFDLELAKSQRNENPVYYIQYAHARICSVWKQLKQHNRVWDSTNGLENLSALSHDIESSLMNHLSQYPDVILTAATRREPHAVANFLQNLATLFHSYYNSFKFIIEKTELRNARLCLMAAVQQVLKNGLQLLGLSAPESM